MTFVEIEKEVRRMDRKLSPSDPAYRAAAIMLSGLVVGTRIRDLARFTGYDLAEVKPIVHRLRASRVLVGGKFNVDWDDPKNGGISFWLDVNVGLGLVQRTP